MTRRTTQYGLIGYITMDVKKINIQVLFNPLNAKLNPVCHLLALLVAHHIFHVSGLRVKSLNEHIHMYYCSDVTDF